MKVIHINTLEKWAWVLPMSLLILNAYYDTKHC
uniref:Uncharacterized protein n=1 Tax=Anguilla anguilla TaxID=7936 RepID=A0A0E9SHI9_ANGAN